jgi:hypothetical protein
MVGPAFSPSGRLLPEIPDAKTPRRKREEKPEKFGVPHPFFSLFLPLFPASLRLGVQPIFFDQF